MDRYRLRAVPRGAKDATTARVAVMRHLKAQSPKVAAGICGGERSHRRGEKVRVDAGSNGRSGPARQDRAGPRPRWRASPAPSRSPRGRGSQKHSARQAPISPGAGRKRDDGPSEEVPEEPSGRRSAAKEDRRHRRKASPLAFSRFPHLRARRSERVLADQLRPRSRAPLLRSRAGVFAGSAEEEPSPRPPRSHPKVTRSWEGAAPLGPGHSPRSFGGRYRGPPLGRFEARISGSRSSSQTGFGVPRRHSVLWLSRHAS
jgi:hypothetical protein